MAYNLGTVRTRVQQKLDDTGFDTSKLNQFINDGQRDILNSKRFPFMERESSPSTISGQNTLINAPTDMQSPLSLRVYNTTGASFEVRYVEYEDIDALYPNPSSVTGSPPTMWTFFNNQIIVYPFPSDTVSLKLKYLKSPTELLYDSDIPEVPETYSEILVLAGYRRALEHNDDYDQAQIVQQQIDILIEKMSDSHIRIASKPHIMRSPNRSREIRTY